MKPHISPRLRRDFPQHILNYTGVPQGVQGRETKPELEIYDVGMLYNVAFMIQQGHLKKPVYLQFVMGNLGGIPGVDLGL